MFNEFLPVFQNLKHKSRRREKFSQPQMVPYGLPPSASTGSMGSVLLRDEAQSAGTSSVALDMDQLQTQDQMLLIDESESYHKSRFNAMQTIESSISELGQIFSQLSMLVAEQGEMVARFDLFFGI
jgi:syntaxin 5